MAYTKQDWTTGEVITEEKLDHMEDGIAQNASDISSLNTSLSVLGSVVTDEGTATIDNSKFVTLVSKTVEPGTYITVGNVWFYGNATGIRIMILDSVETTTNGVYNSVLGTGRSDLSKTRIFVFNTTATIYLRGYQSSGGTLDSKGFLQIMRIK